MPTAGTGCELELVDDMRSEASKLREKQAERSWLARRFGKPVVWASPWKVRGYR